MNKKLQIKRKKSLGMFGVDGWDALESLMYCSHRQVPNRPGNQHTDYVLELNLPFLKEKAKMNFKYLKQKCHIFGLSNLRFPSNFFFLDLRDILHSSVKTILLLSISFKKLFQLPQDNNGSFTSCDSEEFVKKIPKLELGRP